MLARVALTVSVLLGCAAPLSAQVEPELARQLAPMPGLAPGGVNRVNDYAIQGLLTGNKFVGISLQPVQGGPHVLQAFDYHESTNTLSPRPDFNSVTLSSQEITITPDLLAIAVFLPGIGSRLLQRASLTSPWSSPQPILGLLGNEYGLQFCSILGVLRLVVCTPPPNSRIKLYDFDATLGSASNPVTLPPPLGSPNNYWAFVVPLADDLGATRGFIACIRQQLGLQQQFVFTGSVDGSAPWSVFFNTPANSFFIGGAQLHGGRMVAANAGLPIGTLPIGPIEVVGTFTFRTNASTLGGLTDVVAMGPPGDLGVVGIAAAMIPGVAVPGFVNELGLDPTTILNLLVQPMTGGVARLPFTLPPWTPIDFALQGLSIGQSPGLPFVFANTEWLRVN